MRKYSALMLLGSCLFVDALQQSVEGEERRALEHSFRQKDAETVFTDIYRTNYWHGWESISGQGSNVSKTKCIRDALPRLVKDLRIKTMLDAPCGDFNWMSVIVDELDLDLYLGIDIVKGIVKDLQQRYGSARRVFIHANLIDAPIPNVDLIFSRDCLAHLSYTDAIAVIRNFKESGSKYLLTSHHLNTNANWNIVSGDHYPIKLTVAPFNFPEPLLVIEEKDAELASSHQGKCLALWCLDDVDIPQFKA